MLGARKEHASKVLLKTHPERSEAVLTTLRFPYKVGYEPSCLIRTFFEQVKKMRIRK